MDIELYGISCESGLYHDLKRSHDAGSTPVRTSNHLHSLQGQYANTFWPKLLKLDSKKLNFLSIQYSEYSIDSDVSMLFSFFTNGWVIFISVWGSYFRLFHPTIKPRKDFSLVNKSWTYIQSPEFSLPRYIVRTAL